MSWLLIVPPGIAVILVAIWPRGGWGELMNMNGGSKEMEKPKVGQIIYSLSVGYKRSPFDTGLHKFTVTKVGRKYFYACEKGDEGCPRLQIKYRLNDWVQETEYTKTSKLYRDPQEWLDEKEAAKAEEVLCQRFRSYGSTGLSLDQLRRIIAIIEEGED